MKSNVILIDNQGNGFSDALKETQKVAQYQELDGKNAIQLQLLTEEMLSMVRSITGEMKACFWIENEGKRYCLCLTTETVMDKEKRQLLIDASTDRKNAAADSFLGKLRDVFEEAMAAEPKHEGFDDLPEDVQNDLVGREIGGAEWDHYEQSVLNKLADDVTIGIRRGNVNMTVIKTFEY